LFGVVVYAVGEECRPETILGLKLSAERAEE
jgi:hypothetical protein